MSVPSPPEPSASAEASRPPPLGHVGPYELLVELAAGGMATVFLARATDKREGPPLVAVKRPHRHLASDKVFLTMLVDEARLASSIRHPNVVRVRELGFEAGVPFIVMDYVEGVSLAELRKELAANGRCVDVKVALRIALDALAGLHAAHELHDESGKHLAIVHRDVSPHNVLIGCSGRAHITDFGIAKAEDRLQITRTHEVKGKLAYLAPERVDKRRICTVQSDVFAMGVVLWECFAGRRLFRGEDAVEVLQEVINAPVPSLRKIGAQIPVALDDIIARALSRDLDSRYANAAEFAEAIERGAARDIGTSADVARLMEALFSAKMAARHDQVRAVIGPDDLTALLHELGLPERESVTSVAPANLLSELAPPAPSGRYSFGHLSPTLARIRPRRRSWWVATGIAGGVAAGALVTAALMSSKPARKPIVLTAASTAAPAPPAVPTSRKVIVPLPFLAESVTFDDESRQLSPATDVVAFEVPAEGGKRHRVTATALDGTHAEGYVREQDGVARAEGDGFDFVAPPLPLPGEPRRAWAGPATNHASAAFSPAPASSALGTRKNGFTKLR